MPSEQRVVYHAAASVDGFIATPDGGVEWLSGFSSKDGTYERFFAGVGSLVIGRTTFDQVLGWGWPYGDKPAAVLTSSPLPVEAPPTTFAVAGDDLAGVVERLRAAAPGALWIVGGGATAGAFLRAGLLDEIQLGVIPVLLGSGIPLFPRDGTPLHELELVEADACPSGIVDLLYRVAR
jgi:dihydrofolate reductase